MENQIMPELKIILREQDFPLQPGVARAGAGIGDEIASTGSANPDLRRAVMDAVPQALSRRIEALWKVFDGFEMVGFELRVGIEGKPSPAPSRQIASA
jgi:hypothetical protein